MLFNVVLLPKILQMILCGFGTIIAYRSSGGFGVRLDAGDGFQGAEISPYYDSLLVKLSTHAITFKQAEEKWNALYEKCVFVV